MGSLIYQVKQELESQLRIGESRHRAKIVEDTYTLDGIFSYGTLKTYIKQAYHFARWAKEENTLAKARPHVEEYLKAEIDKGLSTYTLSTRWAALCKLYRCTADDFDVKLP